MKVETIVELLYKPLDSDEVLSALASLGLEAPTIDENYVVEQEVVTGKSDLGVDFTFKEIRGENMHQGSPLLAHSSIYSDSSLDLLFGIQWSDSYDTVKEKIGESAKYGNKFIKTMRVWRLSRSDDKEYALSIRFEKDFSKIKTFVIAKFVAGDEAHLPELEE